MGGWVGGGRRGAFGRAATARARTTAAGAPPLPHHAARPRSPTPPHLLCHRAQAPQRVERSTQSAVLLRLQHSKAQVLQLRLLRGGGGDSGVCVCGWGGVRGGRQGSRRRETHAVCDGASAPPERSLLRSLPPPLSPPPLHPPTHPPTLSANMPRRSAREHHTRRVSDATATCLTGGSAYLGQAQGGGGGEGGGGERGM